MGTLCGNSSLNCVIHGLVRVTISWRDICAVKRGWMLIKKNRLSGLGYESELVS